MGGFAHSKPYWKAEEALNLRGDDPTATACLVRVKQSYPEIIGAVKSACYEVREASVSSGKKSMEQLFPKELSVVGLDPPGKEEEDDETLNSLETDGSI